MKIFIEVEVRDDFPQSLDMQPQIQKALDEDRWSWSASRTPKEMVAVDKAALKEVLQALIGPPHLIRELQVTRNIPVDNPINTLIAQYEAA